MLSPFIPVPSSSTPAKPTDHPGSHKADGAAPADGASFHELLARKTNPAAAHSQAPAHAAAHAKAQASNHHNAQASVHAEAQRSEARPAGADRDRPAEGRKDDRSAARDTAEKPVDHAINRRLAKPATDKSAGASAGSKTAADGAERSGAPTELETPATPLDGAIAEASSEEETSTEPTLVEATPLPLEPAQQPPVAVLPPAPLLPLTVGLPSAGTPTPAETTETADGTEAVTALGLGEGNGLGASGQAATPATAATAKARAQAAATPAADLAAQALAAGAAEAAVDDATSAATTVEPTSDTRANTPVAAPALASTDARQSAGAYGLAAQIAAAANPAAPAAQDLASGKINNINQEPDSKGFKKSDLGDGIRRAYELPSMTAAAPVFQPQTASVQVLGPVNANSPVAPTVASTAVRMVEKVSEVADHLATHPAEQVTVRIDLDATHRVDVHVSMRGGQVHADFRSDSPDMRAALASAWNEFSQKRDGSERQWAAPVFAPLAAPATASNFSSNQQTSDGSASYGAGQDSANRQAAERAAQAQALAALGGPARGAASVSAPAPADVKTPIVRSENSQHLSVLA